MKKSIHYCEQSGEACTQTVIDCVVERLKEGDIKYIVVASSSGATALALHEAVKDFDVKIVSPTLHAGFSEPGQIRMDPKVKTELLEKGVTTFMASHALSGANRSITNKFGGTSPLEIVGHTLRLFGGHGIKVCVEVAIMSADAGHIPVDSDIIAIGGTSKGADSAITMRAAHMNNLFDLVIKEILVKPLG